MSPISHPEEYYLDPKNFALDLSTLDKNLHSVLLKKNIYTCFIIAIHECPRLNINSKRHKIFDSGQMRAPQCAESHLL